MLKTWQCYIEFEGQTSNEVNYHIGNNFKAQFGKGLHKWLKDEIDILSTNR